LAGLVTASWCITGIVLIRVWGGGKNGQMLLADLESTAPPGPWGGVGDTSFPTPRDIRAIIDYALEHGWDPTAIGGRHELGADVEIEIQGFRFADLLRDM